MRLIATPEQQEIITSCDRMLGLFAGRRWGKTSTVVNRIIYKTFTQPGYRYCFVTPGYSQLIEEFDKLCSNPVFMRRVKSTKTQPYPRIDLHNKSTIRFRSFERPKRIRSGGFHEVWFDEIQDCLDSNSYWSVLRPVVSDRKGTMGISGQFRGHNWYYKAFHQRSLANTPGYRTWVYPSSTGLCFLGEKGKEELETVRTQIPKAVYDQEYECIPSANIASVFAQEDIDACLANIHLKRGLPGRSYIAGIDLGRVVDHTTIVVLDRASGDCVYAQRWDTGIKHSSLAMLTSRVVRRFNGAMPVIDATGGATGGKRPLDAYLKFYKRRMPNAKAFFWTESTKEDAVTTLSLAIENREIRIADTLDRDPLGDGLIGELRAYEYYLKPSGKYDYHAGPGSHDDYVAALMQAWWARHAQWGDTTGASLSSVIG